MAIPSHSKKPAPNVPYLRRAIQQMVGGEIQTYLPQKDKIILAGCFAIDLMNPNASGEIFVGTAGKVATKAELLPVLRMGRATV